jgi:hypothetical protein
VATRQVSAKGVAKSDTTALQGFPLAGRERQDVDIPEVAPKSLVNRTARLPGRTCGELCDNSPVCLFSSVTGTEAPLPE